MDYPLFNLYEAKKCDTYWYLGSPYTRYEGGIDQAFNDVMIITGELIKAGVSVYSPIVHCHSVRVPGIDPLDYKFWLDNQTGMMKAAYGLIVAQMPGWDESYGVKWELDLFKELDKPIRMLANTNAIGEMITENIELGSSPPIEQLTGEAKEMIDFMSKDGINNDPVAYRETNLNISPSYAEIYGRK
jgi:Domain of unknown function (DUF1937)